MDSTADILKRIWYSSENAAGFGSLQQLYSKARKSLKTISRDDVKEWLEKQEVYTLFQGINTAIKRRRYFSPAAFVMLEADLVFLPGATSNFGVVGALGVIDVFSRFAFLKPIKNKTAKTIALKLKEIFDDPRLSSSVQSLRTDRGKEFDNSVVGQVCQERGIQQYFANPNNKTKCAIIERFNRTFKERMVKMRHWLNKREKGRVRKRWVDLVESVVALYNQSPHRSLDNHSPLFASKPANWQSIQDIQQARRLKGRHKRRANYFRRGTSVRVRLKGGSFGLRASDQKNSAEIFTIAQIHSTRPLTYSLRDSEGHRLEDRFYHEQLVRVRTDK